MLKKSKIVFVNSVPYQPKGASFDQFVHTQVFSMLYIPTVIYIFQHIFNKLYPG